MVDLCTFSERLADLIYENRITPEILSQKINITLSLIYKYLGKKNIPSVPTAIAIANFFKCSLDFLCGLTDENAMLFNAELPLFSLQFAKILSENGYTRYRLKKETHFAKQSVDDWYNGVRLPSIDNLIVLAHFFDCSLDHLVGREK